MKSKAEKELPLMAISSSTISETSSSSSSKKRKRNPKMYGFHTFADPGCPIYFSSGGPFRDNIRFFLQECSEIEDFNVQGMPTWCTLLVHESNGVVVPLYTIEESVKHSLRPFCEHCRCTGWSHHFVSKRRYHLIIPIDDEWDKIPDGSIFDLQTHLLHGLIHCNGFGHLLCVNGVEGGSKFLCGREIMDLWDRICTSLQTKKITVEDVSKKRSMNLRLLYGVAYGHPWFGRWGYKFCHGSFGVTEHKYLAAIEILSSIELDRLVEDFYNMGLDQERKHVKQIVKIYREMSETQLLTIRDLLRFMLTHKSSSPSKKILPLLPPPLPPPPPPLIKPAKQSRPKTPPLKETHNKSLSSNPKYKKFESFAHDNSSRWPSRRLEYAAEVIVNALKEHEGGGMSRQEVRDAARLHIGDTGLLDFVIKSINNLIVGDCVVHRAVNPSTRILEFTIQDIDGCDKSTKLDRTVSCPAAITLTPTTSTTTTVTTTASTSIVPSLPPGLDVYTDIVYLYKQVLEGYPATELAGLATRAILDSKHFVKEWPFRDEEDALLRFICKVVPSCIEIDLELTREIYERPGELVVLPPYATVGELKMAAEWAFRDTYCVLEGFIAREVEGLEELDEEEVLFGAVESGVEVYVVGDINGGVVTIIDEEDEDGEEVELRYEGGSDKWTVDCSCGARDDDGERMVSCDICEVWQHTRCGGIDDSDVVPLLFLCERCGASIMGDDKYCNMDLEYE